MHLSLIRLIRGGLIVAAAISVAAGESGQGARLIEVIADKDNTFKVPGQKKPVIVAKPGEALDLRITSLKGEEAASDGAVHSFVIKKLRSQGWDIRLFPGTHDYNLAAPQQPGEYLVECTVKCGRGHEDMNMKLIIK